MTIHVKLKSSGATGTGYNLNGADPELVDWMLDDESLPLSERLYGLSLDDRRMESLLVEVGGEWIDLAQAITFGQVKVDEGNGGLSYQ